MNFVRLFLIIAVLGFVFQLVLPWWSLAMVSFVAAFGLAKNAGSAFWSGFLGIGLGWLLLSGIYHIRNAGLLSAKVATLFTLPNAALLPLVTALVGALTGGLAALSGLLFRNLIK